MDVTIEELNGAKHVVELGEDDTFVVMRRKVASAVGLPEDGFAMSFGEVLDEGYDMTQLSAGDTIVLTMVKKLAARAALHALGETDITAERLGGVKDPKVACLLLQAEVATVIPDCFLQFTSLTSLDLSTVSVVTEIGDRFLCNCSDLQSIDLSGLINVTQIGFRFLSNCGSLSTLDLTPLNSVTRIKSSFLHGCSALRTLDLRGLGNVAEIEHSFLSGCGTLRTLDVSSLRSVTHFDSSFFLWGCSSLKSIHYTGCSGAVLRKLKLDNLVR